jgi:uncharacterized protein YyaL (SSP411 family)
MSVVRFPIIALLGSAALAHGCHGTGNEHATALETMHAHTNRLIGSSSPYLLQHAHNPVDWYPWGDEAFEKARAEHKLVLVSIGYSSCHWCHVMERECFENDSIAALMNDRYVCIKVDREERPDIDQIYMAAVQLMTGRGGWPLNCFTLPDGRPVYGGTYFPPQQWVQVLNDLSTTWKTDTAKVEAYAKRLHDGVKQSDLIEVNTDRSDLSRRDLARMVQVMDSSFDSIDGGSGHAPKFPMPNNYEFLLRYAWLAKDAALKAHVDVTLHKMALGGIYDQVGGGFARYSTDAIWKVPHFEKMLYDNAQLVSLYAQAYQATKEPLYREVVEGTIGFVERELMSAEGACYSALDADSEGEEGLFYLWSEEELKSTLGAELPFARKYYALDDRGKWEHGKYILLRPVDDATVARETGMSPVEVRAKAKRMNALLLAERSKRVRPALDDKSLTSWNALMVSAWCHAHEALGNDEYLRSAERTMRLLLDKCHRADGGLWHSYKDGKATINGYVEDHAFMIEALIALYQNTFDETWLNHARDLADHTIAHYLDPATGMFFFTSDLDPPLIARKFEVTDNVIPASNSAMCRALHTLGELFDNAEYSAISAKQLNNVYPQLDRYPSGFSNWAQAVLPRVFPCYEIAITGPDALRLRQEFTPHYLPNRVFMGTTSTSTLPLLQEKSIGGSTIFVCENKVCRLPVTTVAEALKLME